MRVALTALAGIAVIASVVACAHPRHPSPAPRPTPDEPGEKVTFRFINAPLSLVANSYTFYSGKQTDVEQGLSTNLTCAMSTPRPPAEAAATIERMLSEEGLTIVPTGTNTARIVRKTNPAHRDPPKPE